MGPKMAAKTQSSGRLKRRLENVAFYISWTNPCRSQIILLISLLDWGHSSVGRALAWHARGRGFESHWLHFWKPYHLAMLRMPKHSAVGRLPLLFLV
jgi:hypothetical protein